MVDLLEHSGKSLFKKYGITVPDGMLVRTADEIPPKIMESVVKAQVPTGHRGKSGGVMIVKNRAEAVSAINKMSGMAFSGFKPEGFLLEEAVQHNIELYVALTLDRSAGKSVLLVSRNGGVDIEAMPKNEIARFKIEELIGITEYTKREAFSFLHLEEKYRSAFFSMINGLWKLYSERDAELVEINPLAVSSGSLVALDAKISIDDDALFRQEEIPRPKLLDSLESEARQLGISFVRLSGNIGLIANGAGLTMATIDKMHLMGGDAGNFLDLGGTDDPSKVIQAIGLVMREKPKVLLINIFGGVTKADTVAEGIIAAVRKLRPNFKIVARLRGFNEAKGREILEKEGINAFIDMDQAIKAAISMSKS
ncbi:succinate--CoA ligase subunit beta [Candidatus Parvarchaeota archaeon]|nr:succinate--CoA ligase subunit beta [Candidatus Parvarchaeota archaeon]